MIEVLDDILDINDEIMAEINEMERIDEEAKKYIYGNASKLKSFKSNNHYLKPRNILESIKKGSFSEWRYQLCYVLAPLYDTCILNIGTICIPYSYSNCWLEILYCGVWYVFDPCSNIICRKESYELQYKAKKSISFSGEEIKNTLIKNAKNKSIFGSKKGFVISLNETYGDSIKYTISEANGQIETISAICN